MNTLMMLLGIVLIYVLAAAVPYTYIMLGAH